MQHAYRNPKKTHAITKSILALILRRHAFPLSPARKIPARKPIPPPKPPVKL